MKKIIIRIPKVNNKKQCRSTSPTDISLPSSLFKEDPPIDFDTLSFASTDLVSASQIGSRQDFDLGGNLSESIVLEPGCRSSDAEAAKRFLLIYGQNNFVVCEKALWVFNKENGMWTTAAEDFNNIITRLGPKLTICETKRKEKKGGKGKESDTETIVSKVYQYAVDSFLTKGMLMKLPCFVDVDNGWERKRFGSDRFKILFSNGYYDCEKRLFSDEADPNIVFTAVCSHHFDLSGKNDEDVHKVKEVFFSGMGNKDSSDTLLHELMRAFVGDYTRKKVIFGLGPTNSGKSGMMKFIMFCLGPLAGTFNGDSILQRRDGCEAARENSWICDIADRRVAFSSEIKVPLDEHSAKTCAINGNMLKRAASGGADVINARGAYGKERNYINKSTLFIFANDLPRINPADDAIRERAIVVEWKWSYVDNPKEPFERKRDENIVNVMMTERYKSAFIWLMINEFEKWRRNDFKNPMLPEICLKGRDEIAPVMNLKELLEQKYEITKNSNDFILARELIDYLSKECDVPGGPSKIGRELSLLGFEKTTKKVNKKPETIRIGLKIKPEEDETYPEI